jgi:fructose-bisphosphate aldolase class II
LQALCSDRFEAFGTAGNAPRIRPLSLAAMAKRYAAGAYGPALPAAKAA